jgi:hypothetical protein
MKPFFYPSLSAFALVLGTITLVGCGGAASFSNPGSTDTPPPTGAPAAQVVAGPAVQGVSYGGHAPIGGQHVYLLQPGTSGYGSAATSLLGSNGAAVDGNGNALNTDATDPNVTPNSKYVVTGSDGSFNLTGAYQCAVGQPVYIYAWGGNIGGGALNNNNIVQLAILGNCPANGSFSGSTALSFVYMNEVSTVAAAYTLQPFTLPASNDAWHIGTSGTTQALVGIANAANTAAQLYDIAGGTTISNTHDGEGHLANTETQLNGVANRGNGIIPQATIDTLANVLAACVDSTVAAVNTITAPCASLFGIATDNGEISGTQPLDTATAMINIARFPAGNHSAGSANVDATFTKDIFAIPTGTVPYVPQLSTFPNDWTLAINYPATAVTVGGTSVYPLATNNTLGLAESIAVDNIGQIWVTAQSGDFINRFSNLGANNSLSPLTYIPGYVSIDASNNAWTGNADCNPGNASCPSGTPIFEAGSNGVFTNTFGNGYDSAYVVLTDGSDDVFFFAQTFTGSNGAGGTSGTTPDYGMFEYVTGGTSLAGPFDCCGTSTTSTTTTTVPATAPLTILAATNTGGSFTFVISPVSSTFTTPLAVGDTVTIPTGGLTNDPGAGNSPAAVGWNKLTSLKVTSVDNASTPPSFTATSNTTTTPTPTNTVSTNTNGPTVPINITSAFLTNQTGGGHPTFTYTINYTALPAGTPPLARGDTVTIPGGLTNDPGVGGTSPAATGWNSITTLTVGAVDSPTEFTATGTTATTNVNSNNVDGEPESDSITINSTSVVAHAGGSFTYTFNFTSTSGGTALAVGDTVTFGTRLTNDPRSGGGTAATGWQNLPSVVVATVNSTTDPTSFTAIGNIPTTDNNAGNGATGKGTYPYFINGATGAGTFNINGATGTGSFPSTTVNTTTSTATTTGSIPSGQNVGHGAIDSGGDLWITSENTGNTIARVTPTGTALFPPITTAEQPEFPAIDASNNAWIAIQKTASQVDVVSPTGGLTVLTPTTQTGTVGTGALMTATFGAAVDGNGNVWFANRAGTYGAVTPGVPGENTIFVLNGGVSTPGNVFQAISPAKNYIPEAQYPATAITFTPILDGSLNLAIDPSGNVWVTNYTGGGIVELVGAAAPVVTPLSVAAGNKQLGQKP